ncbi:MAG: type IV secretion system DNA-binding domain-containing protein, partial [Janthinobacterium lividum]
MTRANAEQQKHTPWFAKAGAACSIIPISRAVGDHAFALKGRGYTVAFSVEGKDDESLTDQELEAKMRGVEGALRSLTEGFCLKQYTRVLSGYDIPRQKTYAHPVTETFVNDRLSFLNQTAKFRRIDIHWCLTIEPPKAIAFTSKPKDQATENSRLLAELLKAATILESHLGHSIGLKMLGKEQAFQFFSYLFNLEDWAERDHLRSDTGVDQQIVKSPVSWEKDHLRVGKRYAQTFCLLTPPEASRPCLFSDLMTLDCDAVLCSSWRPKSTTTARKEIDQQEKFTSFFKVGVMSRVMNAQSPAAQEATAGAKAASLVVDDLGDAIRSLDKKTQGLYSLTLLVAAKSAEQLRDVAPAVHRAFVDARARVMEETLGNLSAFYSMFPGNDEKFQVFPMWLGEDHHARLSSIFAPHTGHLRSEDLDAEYLNVLETRTGTPLFQDPYVNGVKVSLTIGPTGSGKSTLLYQFLTQIQERGESAIIYDPAGEFIKRFFSEERGDVILNPMDARCPSWSPCDELRSPAEARTIAASLYQPTSNQKGEFFVETPQKIFARLLQYRPTPHQLADWMANEEEIDKRVEGTPMKSMIAKGAHQQRSGVLGSLGLVADGLLLLPTKEQAPKTWSATEWSEKREGWIFLSSKKSEREAIRPLHSLWIDLLFLRLGEVPEEGQKRAWFVLDEIASLQRLPQFHTALTENRKSDNPIIYGYQGKAQMEYTYDKLAEVMLSQPATKY